MPVLTKRTSKNQITLPKQAVSSVGNPDYFEVTVDEGRLMPTPARLSRAGAVRRKLQELGITLANVDRAVRWARRR
ncbi:MAG: AbrB/MazE/SpoVT family DNA-binding domain-containing protein [Alphaproteobacteria bacterium]|nr:AbrB/MazE/SpoVT family DNA-binding domain-containing protein [Alphaproteobacteria bacterium]